jgi:creatinine amidohydrolase
VLAFQRDELGIDEDPRLEGLHDDYYITSIIMNDDPRHVRYDERVAAGMASINGIDITPREKTIWHGRQLIDFRTEVTVAAMEAAIAEQRGR